MFDESTYTCAACGEQIVIPVDPSAGSHQEYVEDCPVCCHPNLIRIDLDDEGRPSTSGQAESDRS